MENEECAVSKSINPDELVYSIISSFCNYMANVDPSDRFFTTKFMCESYIEQFINSKDRPLDGSCEEWELLLDELYQASIDDGILLDTKQRDKKWFEIKIQNLQDEVFSINKNLGLSNKENITLINKIKGLEGIIYEYKEFKRRHDEINRCSVISVSNKTDPMVLTLVDIDNP